MTVRVVRRGDDRNPPSLHATYYPTFGVRPGEEVTFQVRAERMTTKYEVWNFGDGSRPDTTRSNVDPEPHANVGYATTSHRCGARRSLLQAPRSYVIRLRRRHRQLTRRHRRIRLNLGVRRNIMCCDTRVMFAAAAAGSTGTSRRWKTVSSRVRTPPRAFDSVER
jgi:hypothetical protein